MEQPVPMDRLICGDVGYGKTEIAVRAAFKAVQDGKQVAVLCPTTLLVQQHFATFAERFGGFPVTVKPVSRFQHGRRRKRDHDRPSPKASVDVVIGTHRLLSGGTSFKNLGLVIIDEEQRFGVEHKERLKQLRTNVDVLAMSATPIPRTLEMAVTGIREMSTIRDAARGAPPGPDLRRHRTTTGRWPPRSAASCCARARSSTSTTGSSRSSARPPGCASWCPRRGSPSRTAR